MTDRAASTCFSKAFRPPLGQIGITPPIREKTNARRRDR
jgi:hypothetical protein